MRPPRRTAFCAHFAQVSAAQQNSNGEALKRFAHRRYRLCYQRLRRSLGPTAEVFAWLLPLVTQAVLPVRPPRRTAFCAHFAQVLAAQQNSNGESLKRLAHRRYRLCYQRLRLSLRLTAEVFAWSLPLVTQAVLPVRPPRRTAFCAHFAQASAARQNSNGEALKRLAHRRCRLCYQGLRRSLRLTVEVFAWSLPLVTQAVLPVRPPRRTAFCAHFAQASAARQNSNGEALKRFAHRRYRLCYQRLRRRAG